MAQIDLPLDLVRGKGQVLEVAVGLVNTIMRGMEQPRAWVVVRQAPIIIKLLLQNKVLTGVLQLSSLSKPRGWMHLPTCLPFQTFKVLNWQHHLPQQMLDPKYNSNIIVNNKPGVANWLLHQ